MTFPQVGMPMEYWPSPWDRSGPGAMAQQTGVPLYAVVVAVNSPQNVNLAVFDAAGKHHARTSVPIVHNRAQDLPASSGTAYAELAGSHLHRTLAAQAVAA